MNNAEQPLSFSVTTYKGFEDEIRGLLNRNRTEAHSRQYLDWRYLGELSPHPPLVFWLRNSSGKPVGMASLISRPYWINQCQGRMWVLGDISLDFEMRGKGVGQMLFRSMNTYIEKNLEHGVLVIPNEAAQKSLFATGWSRPNRFSWFLWVVDPVGKYFPSMTKYILFRQLGAVYRRLATLWLSVHCSQEFKLVNVSSFDSTLDEFWRSLEKEKLILRDRGQASLRWRFERHPHCKYNIQILHCHQKMAGYVVYEVYESGMCKIVDLLVAKKENVRPMVALLLKKLCEKKNIKTVRIKLNHSNIFSSELRKLGFFVRKEKDVFQFFNTKYIGINTYTKWHITVCDKDT